MIGAHDRSVLERCEPRVCQHHVLSERTHPHGAPGPTQIQSQSPFQDPNKGKTARKALAKS